MGKRIVYGERTSRKQHMALTRPILDRWWRSTLVLLLGLSVVQITSCGKDSPKNRAKEFLEAGMYREAVPLLEIQVQEDPSDAESHLLLAKANLGAMNLEEAEEEFTRATLLDPDLRPEIAKTYLEIADLSLGKSDAQDVLMGVALVESALEKDSSIAPEVAQVLKTRGLAAESRDTSFSNDLLLRAIEVDRELRNDEETQIVLARTTKDTARKQQRLEAFAGLFPNSEYLPETVLALGKISYEMGETDEAAVRFQYLKSEYPNAPEASEAQRMIAQIDLEQREVADQERRQRQASERLEQQRLEAERRDQERIAAARAEQARLGQEMEVQRQLERERLEAERLEAELRERQRIEQERLERARLPGLIQANKWDDALLLLKRYDWHLTGEQDVRKRSIIKAHTDPFRIQITSFEPGSGVLEGRLDFTTDDSSYLVSGNLGTDTLDIKLSKRIAGGSSSRGNLFRLRLSQSTRLTGELFDRGSEIGTVWILFE